MYTALSSAVPHWSAASPPSPATHSHSRPSATTTTPMPSTSTIATEDSMPPCGRYRLLRTLRKTLFGRVCLAADSRTQQLVAVKCSRTQTSTKLSFSGEPLLESPAEEIRIMQRLNAHGGHPHVLRLLHSTMVGHQAWSVLEFCNGGELFDRIADGGRLSESHAARYMRQLVSALAFCHSRGIVHLDLSLENVLVDSHDDVRICDFGMARELKCKPKAESPAESSSSSSPIPSPTSASQSPLALAAATTPTPSPTATPQVPSEPEVPGVGESELLDGRPGKIGYMAPEVFAGHLYDGTQADIFSLGVMLFLMLTGIPPWKIPAHSDERFRLIQGGSLGKLLHAWGTPISSSAQHLLVHMLAPSPSRYTIAQILAHPFMTPPSLPPTHPGAGAVSVGAGVTTPTRPTSAPIAVAAAAGAGAGSSSSGPSSLASSPVDSPVAMVISTDTCTSTSSSPAILLSP